MASPATIRARFEADIRADKVHKEVAERYAVSHPSLPRTASRWLHRTKGMPFSRLMLIDTSPPKPGEPAVVLLRHPTRGTTHRKSLSPYLVDLLYPNLSTVNPMLAAALLGR